MEETKRNPLGYEEPRKLIKQFAVPSMISMLVMNLYNIVDQVFIGWKVGLLGNGATNVAFPLTTICIALALLIGIGSASRFGLELGKKNPKIAERSVGNALIASIILGIVILILTQLFMVPMLKAFGATEGNLPYAVEYVKITAFGFPLMIFSNVGSSIIRADGSPKYSMLTMLCGCITNVILDPILMFGMDMGMDGAAIATVISQTVGFAVIIPYFFKMKQVKLSLTSFKMDFRLLFENMTLGLSNCFTQIAILIVQIVMNNSLTYYGELSVYGPDIPLTAFGILMKINSVVIGLFVGIAQGGQPIYSYNYGAQQYDRVKQVFKYAVKITLIISVVAFILYEAFPRQLISLFGTGSDLYFQFSIPFMRIFLCMVLVSGVQLISSNFFAAIAMPWKGTILALCRQTIFLIPLILILPRFMGLEGLMYTGPIADAVAAVASILLIRKEFKVMGKAQVESVEE